MTTTLATSAPPGPVRPYEELRTTKLGDVRAVFSPACYRRSALRALGALLVDGAFYGLCLTGVFAARNPAAQIGFGVLAGVAVAVLFVWAHDAAHGALFRSTAVSELLGTLAMLPSLQMYRLWAYGHNRVHHGFTSYSPIDWIWRPLTPAQYRELPRRGRLFYRLERHPATCGLHYLRRVWWAGMVRFRPDGPGRRTGFSASKVGTVSFAVALSVAAYRFAGGWVGVVAAVVVPFLVFTWVIALVVFLHHTHPKVPFFDDRRDWTATFGQVACATVVRSNRVVERLTHRILIHPPHHIDTRIPFYNLERAYRDLQPGYGAFICEYRLRLSTVRWIFATCKLYDFGSHRWHTFAPTEQAGPA